MRRGARGYEEGGNGMKGLARWVGERKEGKEADGRARVRGKGEHEPEEETEKRLCKL